MKRKGVITPSSRKRITTVVGSRNKASNPTAAGQMGKGYTRRYYQEHKHPFKAMRAKKGTAQWEGTTRGDYCDRCGYVRSNWAHG